MLCSRPACHRLDGTGRHISSAYQEPHTGGQHRVALIGRMSHAAFARTTSRRAGRRRTVGLAVVAAAIIGVLLARPAVSTFADSVRGDRGGPNITVDGTVTEADGELPDGVTVFDDEYPGVANLDADLLESVREAAM